MCGRTSSCKSNKIQTFKKNKEVKITLSQETHLQDTEHMKLKWDWVGQDFAPTKRARAMKELCEEIGGLDIWRITHPEEKNFSFFSNMHKSSPR